MAALLQSVAIGAQLSPDRPLLGLVMIVKNEAKRIGAVLQSYRAHIDAWTILDTGSTDGTQDLIRKGLDGIPGALHEEPFVDFATSRNRALELHGTSTVFSIMPNGDVLSGGTALRAFLEAWRRDFAGAYRVRIAPGHYYHPLVMRTGAGWRYKWRTHECAMGPNVGPQIDGVTVHRDRGARTDEEWRARWSRDLDLLNRDLTEDPNDPRPYFYLGQTHECLGQFAQALAFFEKRATMGGYFDEVYEAKFRVAKMKEKLGRPWAEVQQSYLEAFAHDPRRAEPLFAISEHWYDKVHAISRIFSIAAAEMEKPPTDLFLDESVYTWKAADRAAISSFYSGHKESGRYWAEEAVAASPRDKRLRANRAFFSQSASELFGAAAKAIEFTPEPGWNASNPSIFVDSGRARCVVRTVNYKIVNGSYVTPPDDLVREEGRYKGWQLIRTRNFLLDLDADLKTTATVELADATGAARTSYPVHGFEDARLFAWRGSWWATCTVCDFTEDGAREIALLKIEDDGSVSRADALRGPWSSHQQKNWMPFVEGDVLRFLYATHPTTTFELTRSDDGTPKILHASDASLGHGRLRGGSQGVRVDGGWIFIVHDVAFPPGGGRLYLHRFVLLNEQLQLVSMTDPFYFERLGIEFCAGLAQVGDKLVASYAVNDGSARLGIFDWKTVRRSLRKDFVI
jgi:glycosyltransferase involved in cell wall biosynthesis